MAVDLDVAILAVVVTFLLPLHLLSFTLRLATSGRGSNARGLRRSCATLALTAALLAAIFALPRDNVRQSATPAGVEDGEIYEVTFCDELRAEMEQLKLQLARLESLGDNSKVLDDEGDTLKEKDGRVMRALGLDVQSMISAEENIKNCAAPVVITDGGHDKLWAEVEQLKLQLARLESFWDNSKLLHDKGDALDEKDARIMRALGLDIQSLIDAQESIKDSLWSSYDDSIKAMENEVRVLKDESKRMNSDIYNAQSLAKDTAERVEALHSDVKKVQVITDVWGKMNSNINRAWSFTKDTEKRFEELYSDMKKGFKRTKKKMPFWTD